MNQDHYGVIWKSTEAKTTAINSCGLIPSTSNITYQGDDLNCQIIFSIFKDFL